VEPELVTLTSDSVSVDVDAVHGGRIAQITVDGRPLLVGPDHPRATAPTAWGSFPMVPWAGRIRHGRFRFLGRDIALDTNFQDGDADDPHRRHAIHGTGFTRPWSVLDRSVRTVELSCPIEGGLGWPFRGTAHQRIELDADWLHLELAVSSAGEVFPADIGWHPWFLRPASLDFAPVAMYEQDDIGLPTGRLVEPPPGPWDDCFVNVAPVTLHHDDAPRRVTVESDCDHWVVFDRLPHAVCVEPQSGPPDGPTIRPRLVMPDRPLSRWMTLTWF
jgi:aldose 1-epimerase